MKLDQPLLAGPTVTLRPLTPADAAGLAEAAAESREHYIYTRVPAGPDEAKRYIDAALQEREMPVDEFQAYWLTRHPDVVTKLAGVRGFGAMCRATRDCRPTTAAATRSGMASRSSGSTIQPRCGPR